MESKSPHSGITMHRLTVGGNFPGLLFAVGTALIFLLAIPALWFVLVAALAAGFAIAAVLQITHRWPTESTRLSIKI
jgi:hypothetical protein